VGLGLGLTLAKHLIEQHNGTIEAKSGGRGTGSEFVVHLPVAAEAPIAGNRASPSGSLQEQTMKPTRILVVDDREMQARSLALLLESMGHQVRIATNGHQALNVAMEFLPEVALVDIGLPDMTGYEVARRLREQPALKNMLLIAQTGWGRDEDRERAHEAGFDHHMAKPLNHDELFRLIAHARGE
jgi:CheY-like chemotaxis protein